MNDEISKTGRSIFSSCRKKIACATILIAMAVVAMNANAATTITTEPASGVVGTPDDAGESFVAPVNGDNMLSSFSFNMAGAGTNPVLFNAYLFPFNTTTDQVTGAAVYSSPQLAAAPGQYLTYTFTPLSPVALVPGATYLAVIQQQNEGNLGGTELDFHYNAPGSRQPVDSSYYSNSNSAGPSYAASTWSNDPFAVNGVSGQLDFTATLVPEPSTVSLIAMAGVGLALSFAARKRAGSGTAR